MSRDLPPPAPDRQTPQAGPPPLPPEAYDSPEGAFSGLIPRRNPHSLWSYYLGIFALFPFLGILMAITAIVLGCSALQRYKANPVIRGRTHAIVGIIGAVFSLLVHAVLIAWMVGMMQPPHSR